MRSDFVLRDDGVYYGAVEDVPGSGERVCGRLEVVARTRDFGSDSWGKLLRWRDADGSVHERVLPETAFSRGGGDAATALRAGGLQVWNQQLMLRYAQEAEPEGRVRIAGATGWHQNGEEIGFVFPDSSTGFSTTAVMFSGDGARAEYEQRGTLEDWRVGVAALCRGNSRAVTAVGAAFASMLLWFTGDENGGVHLVGTSSCGKTTVARAAASVFGGPRYMKRWRATDNGLEGVAACHGDALLVLDEMSQCDPYKVGEVTYMLANGEGKLRAGRSGEARAARRWRLMLLSSGETTLAQHVAAAGRTVRAGQEVRLVDLPADAGAGLGIFEDLHGEASGAEFARRLARAAQESYGTPAREFAAKCVENASDLPEAVASSRAEIAAGMLSAIGQSPVSGQVHRVAQRFALFAAAGEMASAWEITGWPLGEATAAAGKCFAAWLEFRESARDSEAEAVVRAVQAFLVRHAESRFTDLAERAASEEGRGRPRATYNRAGWKVQCAGGTEYLIHPEVFRDEVCRGINVPYACRVLAERECLKANVEADKTRYTLQRHTPEGKLRVYVVTSAIWDAGPES